MPRSGDRKNLLANQDHKRWRDANPAKVKIIQQKKSEKLWKRRNEVLQIYFEMVI